MRLIFLLGILLLVSAVLSLLHKVIEAFTSSGTLIQLATSHVPSIHKDRRPVIYIQDINGYIYDYVSQI